MTLDTFVGFTEEPADLDDFLQGEGYSKTGESPTRDGMHIYENDQTAWPRLFYSPIVSEPEEGVKPDWRKSPMPIAADMNVNYPATEEAAEDAEGIVEKLVNKYNAVKYDPQLDEFYRKGEL